MKYLTPEQLLFVHARVIEETGASHGVRDISVTWNRPSRVDELVFEVRDYMLTSSPKLPRLWIPSSVIILLLMETSELA